MARYTDEASALLPTGDGECGLGVVAGACLARSRGERAGGCWREAGVV